MHIAGSHVVVTGGIRGLGAATVDAFLARGARATVLDVDEPGLREFQASRERVLGIHCDVSDEAAVREASVRLEREAGVPDVLVNNAGLMHSAPLVRIGPDGCQTHSLEAWNQVIATNLTSVFLVTAAVVQIMVRARRKGVVVNISSVTASGNAGQSAYSAAKAGVNALTAVWAKELGVLGIRVAAVAPGFSDTPAMHHAVSGSALSDVLRRVPLRRLGRPEEVAHAVLAVVENDFFTGKVFEIDGGYTP